MTTEVECESPLSDENPSGDSASRSQGVPIAKPNISSGRTKGDVGSPSARGKRFRGLKERATALRKRLRAARLRLKEPGPLLTAIGCFSLIFGFGTTFVALFALVNFDKIFSDVLNRNLALSPESPNFHYWAEMEDHYEMHLAWYFFNLTNPGEFASGKAPKVKEIGPFWYNVLVIRDDMEFHENKTVTYRESFEFEYDLQNTMPESTVITTVNVPLLVYLYRVKAEKQERIKGIADTLGRFREANSVVVTRQVKELTYRGWDSVLAGALNRSIDDKTLKEVLKTNTPLKFSLAIQANMTETNVYNMYTGMGDLRDRNRIHSVNGDRILKVWGGRRAKLCNTLQGTLGFFVPTKRKTSDFSVYMPEFCRSFKFRELRRGMWRNHEVERYHLSRDNFFDHRMDAKKICFYDGYDGPKSGATGVWPCKKRATVAISLPHFLYRNQLEDVRVKGLTPNQDKHEYTMDVDMLTGLVVSTSGRLQSNVPVVNSNLVEAAKNLTPLMFPIFWQDYTIEADNEIRDMLKQMSGAPYYLQLLFLAVTIIGSILMIFGLFLRCRLKDL